MKKDSLLWSVTPPGGVQSFLFGTMHTRDNGAFRMYDALLPVIDSVHYYVGEMDLNEPLPDPGKTYNMADEIPSSKVEKARRQILRSYGVDIDQLRFLHPLLIVSSILQAVLRNHHAHSLDELLWKYAMSKGIPVSGLESAAEQMELMHSLPVKGLYKQILEIGKSPTGLRRHTLTTFRLYQRQDIRLLYKVTKSGLRAMKDPLLYKRNETMALRMDSFLKDKSYFVSCGAGHLWGNKGLLALLKRKGWKVNPILIEQKGTIS